MAALKFDMKLLNLNFKAQIFYLCRFFDFSSL